MKLSKNKGERILPEEGTHPARLLRAIDLGTTYSERYNNSTRSIDLTWCLTETAHVFDEEKGEQPFVVSRRFSQKIGPKAALGKVIKSWLGREPEDDFDIQELFNTPCMVSVVYNEVKKDGETNTYANVDNVMKVPKGMKVSALQQEPQVFDLDEFDQDAFMELPEFMREIIARSDEYKELKGSEAPAAEGKKADFLEDLDK